MKTKETAFSKNRLTSDFDRVFRKRLVRELDVKCPSSRLFGHVLRISMSESDKAVFWQLAGRRNHGT